MAEDRRSDVESSGGGQLIQFPTGRTTPPPLPRLPRAIPTPGAGSRSNPVFGAALTLRFDREAA